MSDAREMALENTISRLRGQIGSIDKYADERITAIREQYDRHRGIAQMESILAGQLLEAEKLKKWAARFS